jgi:hypothetical protein
MVHHHNVILLVQVIFQDSVIQPFNVIFQFEASVLFIVCVLVADVNKPVTVQLSIKVLVQFVVKVRFQGNVNPADVNVATVHITFKVPVQANVIVEANTTLPAVEIHNICQDVNVNVQA